MELCIFILSLIIIILIIRLYNYYKPNIDIVLKGNQTSILLWYNKRENHAGVDTEIRYYKTLITF